MPNHITHRITITGDAAKIAAFKAAFVTEEGDECFFDFNKIIPMPESVRQTECSSVVDIGLFLLGKTDLSDYLDYSWVKDAGVTDIEGLKVFLEERHPDARQAAESSVKAMAETNYPNWYEWSIANWGTKWNSYSFDWGQIEPNTVEMRFDTAWSVPEPVFEVLADRPECEGLRIVIAAFDEGWGFAYTGVIEDGCLDGEFVEANAEMYETVYGEKPETYDEEMESVS